MVEPSIFNRKSGMPASLRKPVERAGLQGAGSQASGSQASSLPGSSLQEFMGRSYRSLQEDKRRIRSLAEARPAIAPGAFCRMLDEPEDARLTGATRSLPRRLLALNLPGSLRPLRSFSPVKVA